MAEYQTLIIACGTGFVSSVITVTTMRVDIVWLKKSCTELYSRVRTVEEAIAQRDG